MITLYILQCAQGKYYTGITNNLARRIHEHSSGHSGWTSHNLPISVIHTEQFNSRSEARKQEVKIKKRGAFRYMLGLALKSKFHWKKT
jgi:predicted GIY-YIG superfamily endonuclease